MPSTKSLAIAMTAIAVSQVNASRCNLGSSSAFAITSTTSATTTLKITESTTIEPTTTSEATPTATPTCDGYEIVNEPPENSFCGRQGDSPDGEDIDAVDVTSLDDCVNICKSNPDCIALGYTEAETENICHLRSSLSIRRGGGAQYYDIRCFVCRSEGRGGISTPAPAPARARARSPVNEEHSNKHHGRGTSNRGGRGGHRGGKGGRGGYY